MISARWREPLLTEVAGDYEKEYRRHHRVKLLTAYLLPPPAVARRGIDFVK